MSLLAGVADLPHQDLPVLPARTPVAAASPGALLQIRLSHASVVALVDTGAARSILSPAAAAQAGPGHLEPTDIRLHAVAGSQLHIKGVCTLPIQVGTYTFSWPFLVVEDACHPVILGRDLLAHAGACIDMATGQVHLPHQRSLPLLLAPAGPTAAAATTATAPVDTLSLPDLESSDSTDWLDPHRADEEALHQRLEVLAAASTAFSTGGRTQLKILLRDHASAFAPDPKAPAPTFAATHVIPTGEARPVRQRYRRLSPAETTALQTEVNNMLRAGVIRPSSSAWASPVVLASKPDGGIRVCIDYRALNSVTDKDAHPLPHIDDLLGRMSGCHFFSKLDLASGYWQVPVASADMYKTAFATPFGLYEFTRMPFGLCNAPATFQRMMLEVLGPMLFDYCTVYLDDIIVFSRTEADHLQHVAAVLARLRAFGLHARDGKSVFGVAELPFLGHVVSAAGVSPNPAKVAAIRNMPVPADLADIRRFLGMVGYYRKFIKDFAHVAEPLIDLSRGTHSFKWTDACTAAFDTLRTALVTAPILVYPNFSRLFTLQTDASDVGIGAVLTQLDDAGDEHPVAYASRTLSATERNYSATERECLAVVWAVRHFRAYVHGAKFAVQTDHHALAWLRTMREPAGRLARWVYELQGYDFTITYRPGRANANADGLSRLLAVVTATPTDTAPTPPPDSDTAVVAEFVTAQRHDPACLELIDALQHKVLPSERARRRFVASVAPHARVLPSGLLVYDDPPNSPRVVLPAALRPDVLAAAHDIPTAGHLGFDKTWPFVRARYFWEHMRRDVFDYVASCALCQARATPRHPSFGHLQPIQVHAPWEILAMDVLGPLPTSQAGNKYILVCMDLFTSWVEAFPLPTQDAPTLARPLVDLFCRFGCPQRLLSDNGPAFASGLLKEVTDIFLIKRVFTTPYHPQTDGLCERFMATIATMLSKFVNSRQTDWDTYLPQLLFAYRSRDQATIGIPPFEALFGRAPHAPADPPTLVDHRPPPNDYPGHLRDALAQAHASIVDNREAAQDYRKRVHDDRHPPSPFSEGDLVLLHHNVPPRGTSLKLYRPWKGPYTIARLSPDKSVATLRAANGHELRHKTNVARLKKYVPRPAALGQNSEPSSSPTTDPDEDTIYVDES